MSKIERKGDDQEGRFIILEEGEKAGYITYKKEGEDKIVIEHTVVEEEFGGRGLAKKLVMKTVDYARENDLKIVPVCSYVQHRFDKDEEIRDVLAKD